MTSKFGLLQQQTAAMAMTPQLQQAIKILQLSTSELHDYLNEELVNNPLLEFASEGDHITPYAPSEYDHNPYRLTSQPYSSHGHDDDPLALIPASGEVTLADHLMEQLQFMSNVPASIRAIMMYMIGNLDPNGYLELSALDISHTLSCKREEVEYALSVLQSFEPYGVGAMSLRECLLIQLQHIASYPSFTPQLIQHHLEDIARHRMTKLVNLFQTTLAQIQTAIHIIKQLNPRPGASFSGDRTTYITPDVVIDRKGGGGDDRDKFVVTVLDRAAPRLTVNNQYYSMLAQQRSLCTTHSYVKAKRSEAQFLMKCVAQRHATLLRVTEAIVAEQIQFFRNGKCGLKPLTLKQVAAEVQLHESTVSRATNGKYAQTPWGLFELKFFFPTGVSTDQGEDASSLRIKERLKIMVAQEHRSKPHSDQKLTELLHQEGIHISRRTVMKYREELGILSSAKRKL
ncbi:RNA polymerase factor sigma-54 [Paenibacillus sp. 481]|uniref:RNA polymerase factor sigma-54 n=1 Tax=Paenibacillus sp. 481 TaxID=2835869 RepID=UPI001E2CB07B|nr:RNA polymerase factor sigma-54 [Paenibacillus sp. 481]UHA73552.1 RNA polymerase factor sigma-54 [Paenibacillus sp. 481]